MINPLTLKETINSNAFKTVYMVYNALNTLTTFGGSNGTIEVNVKFNKVYLGSTTILDEKGNVIYTSTFPIEIDPDNDLDFFIDQFGGVPMVPMTISMEYKTILQIFRLYVALIHEKERINKSDASYLKNWRILPRSNMYLDEQHDIPLIAKEAADLYNWYCCDNYASRYWWFVDVIINGLSSNPDDKTNPYLVIIAALKTNPGYEDGYEECIAPCCSTFTDWGLMRWPRGIINPVQKRHRFVLRDLSDEDFGGYSELSDTDKYLLLEYASDEASYYVAQYGVDEVARMCDQEISETIDNFEFIEYANHYMAVKLFALGYNNPQPLTVEEALTIYKPNNIPE